MQLAILIVLLLILLVIAPWMLGLFALAAAAYGVWLVAGFVLTLVFGAIGLLVLVRLQGRPASAKLSGNMDRQIAEANRLHREQEAARQEAKAHEEQLYAEYLQRQKLSKPE